MKNKKPSRYSQELPANVTPINFSGSALDVGFFSSCVINGEKKAKISLLKSASGEISTEIDVSSWTAFPYLMEPMSFAVLEWAKTVCLNTRSNGVREIHAGVFQYLLASGADRDFGLSEISTSWINGYIEWLSQSKEDGSPVWAISTRVARLDMLRIVIRILRASEKWGHQISRGLRVRSSPWRAAHRRRKVIEVLDNETYVALLQSCKKEIDDRISTCRDIWARVEDSKHALSKKCNFHEGNGALIDCLVKIDQVFDFPVVMPADIKSRSDGMWDEVLASGGFRRVFEYCYPRPRDVVPFVILMAAYTGFNADVVRGLKLSEIEFQDGMGGARICLRPFKGRSGRKQNRSFSVYDPQGPAVLVDFIKEWTAKIRPYGKLGDQDRLFVFVHHTNELGLQVGSYTSPKTGKSNGKSWFQPLSMFLEEYGLPKIQLAQIRKTVLDFVHQINDGDLKAVQVIGGQRKPQTIESHYTSSAAIKRNEEKLAGIMATRERLVRTVGKSADTRKEPYSADIGCATPGFRCFDPYQSPIPGELEGRLCQAYGACSICPLAHVAVNDPYVLGRILQLRCAIEDAQSRLDPQRWIATWAPRLRKINDHWLPMFNDADVLAEAAAMSLPPLPPLE